MVVPQVTPVPHVIRTISIIAGALLDNATDLVTVQKLLGQATVQTTAHDEHPGDGAQQQTAGTVQVPS
jgi:site-specific recombinase XerD